MRATYGFGATALCLAILSIATGARACLPIGPPGETIAQKQAAARRYVEQSSAVIEGEVTVPQGPQNTLATLKTVRVLKGTRRAKFIVERRTTCDVSLDQAGRRGVFVLYGGPQVYQVVQTRFSLAMVNEALGIPSPPPPVEPPPTPRNPRLVASPIWLRTATQQDIERFYPDRAMRTETQGDAIISCWVSATGALADCTVVAETPSAYGFGDAAIRLSRAYRMQPVDRDDLAVEGGVVRVPIRFRPPEPQSRPDR